MNINLNFERESPFEPHHLVSSYFFKGRDTSIEKIIRYYPNAHNFDVQHFFLTGPQSIGKTSLAKFVNHYLEYNHNTLGIYVSNSGVNSVEKLVTSILKAFLNKKFFKAEKPQILLKEDSKYLVRNLHYILNDLVKEFDDYNCIFLILDDINDLPEKEFVSWYKRFADTIKVDNSINMQLYVLCIGHSEKFNKLILQDSSFGRIFHHEKISKLKNEDVGDFFTNAFESAGMKCEKDALDMLVQCSQGSPLIMQHIGEAVFWQTKGDIITKEIAANGVLTAVNNLGSAHIIPDLNKLDYPNILLKLGKHQTYSFCKSDLETYLSDEKNYVLDNFLAKMIKTGILNSVGVKNSEESEFSNMLYFTYFMIKANEETLD